MDERGEDALRQAMAALWTRARPRALEGIAALEDAIAALMADALDDATRDAARREAHRLAGSLGTVGIADASPRARRIELALEAGPAFTDAPALAEEVVALRRQVEGHDADVPVDGGGPPAAEPGETAPSGPELLLRGVDGGAAGALREAALGRGWSPATDDAAAKLAVVGPAVADLAAEVHGLTQAGAAVAVLVDPGGDDDPVELVRAGAGRLLPLGTPASTIVEELAELEAAQRAATATILCVDDDPVVLAALRAMLAAAGHEPATLQEPAQLWRTLETARPELLILDIEMPGSDGIALCRALRADPRWRTLPVLFLTSRVDAPTVQALFEAGADDYVAKPVLGPELVARVANRLERAALLRRSVEVDPLTGLLRRDAARVHLDRMLRSAQRLGHPLWVGAVAIDGLRELNETYGPAAGDAALEAAGAAAAAAVGPEELAARWAGGDLVLAMLGLSAHDARHRLAEVVEAVRLHDGDGPAATAAAGLAEHPADGADPDALVAAAIRARRTAAAAGGDRVAATASDDPDGAAHVDVAVVEDDELLADLLVHSLRTRGYTARVIGDGEEAARALVGERPQLRAKLVLLDWDLPGRDGLTVLRGLAETGALARTRVVMLTARASERETLEALELGAVDHVAKPFSVAVLMQRVRRALAR